MKVREIQFHVLPMETRFPFKYGIASMTHLPHLFVSTKIELNGSTYSGLATEGLPPKWFTKIPDTTFEQDLKSDLNVIHRAAETALNLSTHESFFNFWHDFYQSFKSYWSAESIPSLLANFALSLVERSALDAFCKAYQKPIHQVILDNDLGIQFIQLDPELSNLTPKSFLDSEPISSCWIRHTVGLGDPLQEINPEDRPQDNLPFTLVENIESYQLQYFKLKLSGNDEVDLPRMESVANLLREKTHGNYQVTLDGNEQFQDLKSFHESWEKLNRIPVVHDMLTQHLILVEQPVHRNQALEPNLKNDLKDWPDAPPIIIDEADGDLDSLPLALDLGYAGTSHKNCKGIIKGLINAARLHNHQSQSGKKTILSGEDLANVGPFPLLQDLSLMNVLGITHVERNGHHYFNGLSMIPEDWQAQVMNHHNDLYASTSEGYPTLNIKNGKINTDSINQAPFGSSISIDVQQLESLDTWATQNL